jgi:hypothetical protein
MKKKSMGSKFCVLNNMKIEYSYTVSLDWSSPFVAVDYEDSKSNFQRASHKKRAEITQDGRVVYIKHKHLDLVIEKC